MILRKIKILFYFFVFIFALNIKMSMASQSEFRTADDVLNIKINTDVGTKIEIESENINLNLSDIKWYIGDKLLMGGNNQSSFNSQNSYKGQEIKIIISNTQGYYTTSFKLSGNNITILWEGTNTPTPSWWQGKPQAAFAGKINIWAIGEFYDDNNKRIDDKNINYLWYTSDDYVPRLSGFGKSFNQLEMPTTTYNDLKLRIVAKNSAGETLNDKTIYIESFEPMINLYRQIIENENNIPENIFDIQKVQNFETIYNKNINLIIEPMFFTSNKTDLSYYWKINDIEDLYSKNIKNLEFTTTGIKDLILDLYVSSRTKIGEDKSEKFNLYTDISN